MYCNNRNLQAQTGAESAVSWYLNLISYISSAGIVCNVPEFYEAFGVKEGDKLFRSNETRVDIW